MANINIKEGILAILSEGLQGYIRGKQYRAEQARLKKEEEKQAAAEEKKIAEENRKREGQLIYDNAYKVLSNLDPRTGYNQVQEFMNIGLDAATQAGYDPGQAHKQLSYAAGLPSPLSELDLAKLETEKATAAATTALGESRQSQVEVNRARAAYYKARKINPGQSRADKLDSEINALTRSLEAYTDDFGDPMPEYQAEYDDTVNLIGQLRTELRKKRGISDSKIKSPKKENDPLGIR